MMSTSSQYPSYNVSCLAASLQLSLTLTLSALAQYPSLTQFPLRSICLALSQYPSLTKFPLRSICLAVSQYPSLTKFPLRSIRLALSSLTSINSQYVSIEESLSLSLFLLFRSSSCSLSPLSIFFSRSPLLENLSPYLFLSHCVSFPVVSLSSSPLILSQYMMVHLQPLTALRRSSRAL